MLPAEVSPCVHSRNCLDAPHIYISEYLNSEIACLHTSTHTNIPTHQNRSPSFRQSPDPLLVHDIYLQISKFRVTLRSYKDRSVNITPHFQNTQFSIKTLQLYYCITKHDKITPITLHYHNIKKALIKSCIWTPTPTITVISTYPTAMKYDIVPFHCIKTNIQNKTVFHHSCSRS
jgi:hypothetical protein